MSTLITLAELRRRSVDLRYYEAVALAQKLIHADVDAGADHAPFGLLSPGTVALSRTGRVHSLGGARKPTAGEVALFLQGLLEDKAAPGGLRYAIGRALFDVEAPPYDSLADFSVALQRFESGDRDEVIRGLVARAEVTLGFDAARVRRPPDRRRRGPTISAMRRELRHADLSLYEATVAGRGPARPSLRNACKRGPFFACVVAGMTLIAAGQFADTRGARTSSDDQLAARDVPLAAGDIRLAARDVPLPADPLIPAGLAADEAGVRPTPPPNATPAASQRSASRPLAKAPASAARAAAARQRVARARRTAVQSSSRSPRGQLASRRAVAKRAAPNAAPKRSASIAAQEREERKDDGVLLRIRFEWDNPFKRAH